MSWVHVSVKSDGIAFVTLKREPVNTMNLEMWSQLSTTLKELESNSSVRAVIFCSGVHRDVFTAGNDILELYAPHTSKERYRDFWIRSNTFLIQLRLSRLVTIAAIKGACPAGGCCLALCCDYRVMTDAGSIGLNEVALGITVPKFWGKLMQQTIGPSADRLLQLAVLVSPEEALKLGLVDEICAASKLEMLAENAARQMLRVPDKSRAGTKMLMRGDFCKDWEGYLEYEAAYAWDLLNSAETIATLGKVLERLGGKKTTKKDTAKM